MIKKLFLFLLIPFILFVGSCASTKTALNDQNDDVYYSVAKAKEIVPQTIVQNEDKRVNDYITDENLYGDSRDDYGYYNDYSSRFNRFGTFAPSLGYYNSYYGYNYDPFYSNMYFPNSYFGGTAFNLGFGFNNFNYNPWRTFGYNYGFGSNIWNPYANYNSFAYGYGNGYYGGSHAGIYSSPAFNAPNYRSRPSRTSDNLGIYSGSVNGNPNSIGAGSPNNNTIQRSRAERYGVQTQPNAGATQNSGTRTQQVTRPERVNQAPPQRAAQPERIYTAPPQRQDTGSGSGSRSNPAPSNNTGGSSTSRPSRGN